MENSRGPAENGGEALNWKILLSTLAVTGAVLGAGGAILQIRFLRFGALATDQRFVFWAFFLAAGIGITLFGSLLARLFLTRNELSRNRILTVSPLFTILFFVLFIPWNLRDMPNVFLLITDATRADHLSLYGYERDTTPFLREMAGRSVVFNNMVSQGSHTIVTSPCILASCYPSEHGITGYSDVLSEHFTLLSEYLKENGYATYGYATNPHLGPRVGYSQGFDQYGHDPSWAHTPAGNVNSRFMKWLDVHDERPFFCFHFYIDPHNPYLSPPDFQRLFDSEWTSEPVSDWKHELGEPEPRTLFNLLAQYDGSIAYWDSEFRKMADLLKDRGEFDNSVFVYTSDHGEEFWEHGQWGHQRTLFEESIHVPLLISFPVPIRFPRLQPTSRFVYEVASSVDIVPTVLEFLRIEPDENARGSSLLKLAMQGKEGGPERTVYCEEILNRYGPYDLRAVRSQTTKYIMTFNYEGARDLDDMFFDLEKDSLERSNILTSEPEEALRHREILATLVKEIAGHAPARVDTIEIDPATRERLRALGYLN